MVILGVGAALSVAKIEPWADGVLIAGAIVVVRYIHSIYTVKA